jgi:hypothetical protein
MLTAMVRQDFEKGILTEDRVTEMLGSEKKGEMIKRVLACCSVIDQIKAEKKYKKSRAILTLPK